MCFFVVALPANRLQIVNCGSLWVINSIKRLLVVYVDRDRCFAHLTFWRGIAIQFTDLHPLPVITPLNAIASELLTLLGSLCTPECPW